MKRKPETSAAPFVPESCDLATLRQAAAGCRGCSLYVNATQTVFGEGPASAAIMLVGEKPGDKEDRVGKPFVGPAGGLLDRALVAAGIPRQAVYVTNAVKHFKWEQRGKRRIHKKPTDGEIAACRPWLQAELATVQANVLVCMGVSAARAAFGHSVRLADLRGRFTASALAEATFVTVHPSALLRIPESDLRRQAFDAFVDDLRQVAKRALGAPRGRGP